ncbi:MAG: lysophospholipid acyltransferase family protein, partial [Jatrophihabitantaceae bacterium]
MPRTSKLRRPGYGEKLGIAWGLVMGVLYLPFSVLVKIRYLHLDRLPQQGPAIIVVNHVSHVDPFLVAKMIIDGARRPRFLAKDAIFEVPVVGAAMSGMGHIPVKRGSVDARESLAAAVDALRKGGLIVLHPEGTVTRDPDGWPMAGKTGAARLAMLVQDVPVIPIAQWGVQKQIDLYRKKIKLIPRPRHVLSV